MNASAAVSAPVPTAPGGLPLIGHAHHLVRTPLPFISSLRDHGSVVRIRLGPTPAYVVTDPVLTRTVLVTEAAHFAKGGKIFDVLRGVFGDGLATIGDGDTHLRNRRLMQPMFNKAHIATRRTAMIEQARAMVAGWDEGQLRDVFADMNDVTLAAFLVALFGADLPAHLQREFTTLMPELMKGAIRQTVLPPWVTRLPLPANRAQARGIARLRALMDQAIDHRSTRSTETPADVAEAGGCPHQAAADVEQPGLFETLRAAEDQFTREQLQDEAITLMNAAIETTATALAWTLYELTRHPEIEERLRAELAAVCGGRPLREEDLDELSYAMQVLQEGVRKYGPAWMVTRTATRDVDLGGYRIPQGADVVWSPYLHQNDPAHFPDPDAFDPDRWADGRLPSTRESFFAFGDGRRKCIGENFAWVEMQVILATVLEAWPRFRLVSRPPRPETAITVKPDRLTMAFGTS
ncbi:pentalenene oxygenase [Streptomyces sp. TLI_55]|uniref:cytochrome P450 n=1 Tax=Streptomyces sp. TLI_55 TaxID=1938861 RepID=UPI000BDC4BE1|nr:cytochrome P450 [Streptomyces sp. TLI_55]SNX55765.1 pentalenene oxygenase [Streptomyces sp. TLI_55]